MLNPQLTSQPVVHFYCLSLCKHINPRNFDSDCQLHSDDSINLKGPAKNIPFLFISRSFFVRTISIFFTNLCIYISIYPEIVYMPYPKTQFNTDIEIVSKVQIITDGL